jgi:hypothetical protein
MPSIVTLEHWKVRKILARQDFPDFRTDVGSRDSQAISSVACCPPMVVHVLPCITDSHRSGSVTSRKQDGAVSSSCSVFEMGKERRKSGNHRLKNTFRPSPGEERVSGRIYDMEWTRRRTCLRPLSRGKSWCKSGRCTVNAYPTSKHSRYALGCIKVKRWTEELSLKAMRQNSIDTEKQRQIIANFLSSSAS